MRGSLKSILIETQNLKKKTFAVYKTRSIEYLFCDDVAHLGNRVTDDNFVQVDRLRNESF